MKLKNLPSKIALLAMQRISEQGRKPIQDDDIANQFKFQETPEGTSYWNEILCANFIEPVYSKPKGSRVIIKLTNDLWNGVRN